jgi:hypothetical protein
MEPVRFGDGDAWLLWTIPPGGCDLEHVLNVYVFVARDAVPMFGRVRECLSRAARAGILLSPAGGRFELAPAWQERFGQIVGRHSPTELGLMELDEFLAAGEWPPVAPDFALGEEDYRQAAERVERHYADVFGRS